MSGKARSRLTKDNLDAANARWSTIVLAHSAAMWHQCGTKNHRAAKVARAIARQRRRHLDLAWALLLFHWALLCCLAIERLLLSLARCRFSSTRYLHALILADLLHLFLQLALFHLIERGIVVLLWR